MGGSCLGILEKKTRKGSINPRKGPWVFRKKGRRVPDIISN